MGYRTRIKYTAEQKAEMWDRWPRGESLNSIGRVFDRPSSSIFGQLAPSGGIRPSPRQRSRLALTLSEREEISRGVASHLRLGSLTNTQGVENTTILHCLRFYFVAAPFYFVHSSYSKETSNDIFLQPYSRVLIKSASSTPH